MSPREFANCFSGWSTLKESGEKQSWERARYIAKACVSIHVAKKERHKLEQAFKLPWDEEVKKKEVKKLTPNEFAAQEKETERIAHKINKILK